MRNFYVSKHLWKLILAFLRLLDKVINIWNIPTRAFWCRSGERNYLIQDILIDGDLIQNIFFRSVDFPPHYRFFSHEHTRGPLNIIFRIPTTFLIYFFNFFLIYYSYIFHFNFMNFILGYFPTTTPLIISSFFYTQSIQWFILILSVKNCFCSTEKFLL
jgi:hypothetical protein